MEFNTIHLVFLCMLLFWQLCWYVFNSWIRSNAMFMLHNVFLCLPCCPVTFTAASVYIIPVWNAETRTWHPHHEKIYGSVLARLSTKEQHVRRTSIPKHLAAMWRTFPAGQHMSWQDVSYGAQFTCLSSVLWGMDFSRPAVATSAFFYFI